MKKKVFIHIGLPKTGTSSVQSFLSESSKELMNYGVLYPKAGLMGAGHHKLAAFFYLKNPPAPLMRFIGEPYLKLLKDEMLGSKASTIVLSSEMFADIDNVEGMKRYFNECELFDIKVICFFRRQDVWLESSCIEEYKTGITTNLDLVLSTSKQRKYLNYDLYLNVWEKVFGRDNILVGVLDDRKGEKDAVAYFIKLLELVNSNIDLLVLNAKKVNARLAPECTHYSHDMHMKNNLLPVSFFKILEDYSVKYGENKKYTLFSDEQRKSFLSYFKVSNKALENKYFQGKEVFSEIYDSSFNDVELFPDFNEGEVSKVSEYISLKVGEGRTRAIMKYSLIPKSCQLRGIKKTDVIAKYECRKCSSLEVVELSFFQKSYCRCTECGEVNVIFPFNYAVHPNELFSMLLKEYDAIAIWGAGGFYRECMAFYKESLSNKAVYLVDSDVLVQGLFSYGKEVNSPEIITELNIRLVIVALPFKEKVIRGIIKEKYLSVTNILLVDFDVNSEGNCIVKLKEL